MSLKKWFYEIKDTERNQVYLANTLEPFVGHNLMAFMREINEESRTANALKLTKNVLVITGNPPYRGMSVNKGQCVIQSVARWESHQENSDQVDS